MQVRTCLSTPGRFEDVPAGDEDRRDLELRAVGRPRARSHPGMWVLQNRRVVLHAPVATVDQVSAARGRDDIPEGLQHQNLGPDPRPSEARFPHDRYDIARVILEDGPVRRIRDEFSKLLLAEGAEHGLLLLDRVGLLVKIVPELEAGKGMQQGGYHSHDVFGHSLLTAGLTPPDLVTRLAGLFHDVGKPACHELRDGKPTFIGHPDIGATMAGTALHRLRYSGELIEHVTKLIRLHMRPIQYDPSGWEDKAVRRLVRDAGDQLDRLLDLARADMRASHYPDVKKVEDLEARIRRLDAQAIAAIRSPLTGDELMARTGLPAGPWIKRVKSALEDAIVDGTLAADADAAWRYLDQHPELLRG